MNLGHLRLHFHPHYFSRHISKDLRELFYSATILEFASASFALFEPVYLFTLGFSIPHIMMYVGAIYALYAIVAPFGGKFIAHFGVRRGILVASISQILYFISLYLISFNHWFIVSAVLFMTLQKTFYWPAYHKDFVETSDADDRGREVSFMKSLILAADVAGPIFGGFLLAFTSFHLLFIIVIVLILLSNLPLYRGPGKLPMERFSIARSWQMLREREHRPQAAGFLGFGEELIEFTLWPLFIFLILDSTAGMGLYFGGGTLLAALFLLRIGTITDSRKKHTHTFLAFGSGFLSLSWLARIFVASPVPIFFANFLGGAIKDFTFVMISTMGYEQARKEHPLTYAVFMEQTLAIGKTILAFIIAGVFATLGFYGAWLLAAAFALLYAVFPTRSR